MSLWMKSLSVTIQMKYTEQYFPVVLFIILYKVVLTFESVAEIEVTLTWMFQTVLIGSQPVQEVRPSLPEL